MNKDAILRKLEESDLMKRIKTLESFWYLHDGGEYRGQTIQQFLLSSLDEVERETIKRVKERLSTSIVTTCHNCEYVVHMFPDDVTKELDKALAPLPPSSEKLPKEEHCPKCNYEAGRLWNAERHIKKKHLTIFREKV